MANTWVLNKQGLTMTNKTQPQFLTQKPARRRVQLKCPETSTTDPDAFRELSIASIKSKLEKGIISNNFTNNAFYSLKPLNYTNLQDVLNFHQTVVEKFEALPSAIRKAMGNNIHNFESFLEDPKNNEILLEYGIINEPKQKPSSAPIS